ncbi:hypothetical protein U1499_13825 [Aeromonas caviae]|uniref:hypothetical protein n=1 Tax=Aeromonas caviae TaxID=648 RepID=UPI00301449DD
MEQNYSLTDKMKNDSDFQSKRKQLIIVSILLMAMSLSNAQLKEANTFIFKIDFSNSAAFGWMVFFGVIVLVVRYYSLAFKYHSFLYTMWADKMISDWRLLSYFHEEGEKGNYKPTGLLSKLNDPDYVKFIEYNSFDESSNKLAYKVKFILKRSISFRVDYDSYFKTVQISLNNYDENWTRKDLLQLLKIEFEYRRNALFRQPEHLDILLPYMIAFISLISFVFKHQILSLLQ